MENKTYQITKIIILSVIAFILIGILIYFLTENKHYNWKWNFQKDEVILCDETYTDLAIEQIHLAMKSTDITVKASQNDQIRIIIYGQKDEHASTKVENNQLYITKEEKNEFCFGFCFGNSNEVVIYLPSDIQTTLDFSTNSGDIRLDHFKNVSMLIDTSSGDVKAGSLFEISGKSQSGEIEVAYVENASIKTQSGDMKFIHIIGSADLKTSSGDIEIEHFQVLKNSNIETSSGDVEISYVNDCYVNAETKSGDIHIKNNNRFSKIELGIITSSGDIEVK